MLVEKLHLYDRGRVNDEDFSRLSDPLQLTSLDALDVEEVPCSLWVDVECGSTSHRERVEAGVVRPA